MAFGSREFLKASVIHAFSLLGWTAAMLTSALLMLMAIVSSGVIGRFFMLMIPMRAKVEIVLDV
jgi:hypothetical protein